MSLQTRAPELRKPDLVGDHPATLAPIYHQIPAELQARKQWVVWAWALDANGKWTKEPDNPRTGGKAKTNASRTWGTFEQAKAAYLENPIGLAGIGYVFSKNDPYCTSGWPLRAASTTARMAVLVRMLCA
jgi:hypothetical protein